jgi:hypothetical protein
MVMAAYHVACEKSQRKNHGKNTKKINHMSNIATIFKSDLKIVATAACLLAHYVAHGKKQEKVRSNLGA